VTDRRRFIVTAVGFLAAPLAAEAQQQTGKVYRIGYLYRGSKSDAVAIPGYLPAFLEGLRRLGYVEGKNLTFEVWAAEGHSENLPTLAADLVRTKPGVIVVHGAGDAVIVQKLTKTVPIVTLSAGDLAASGVVASVANPGGNVTGMQVYSSELMAKRLEILKATIPSLRRIAVLRAPIKWREPEFSRWQQATDDPAATLGIKARYIGFDDPDQLPGLFNEMAKKHDEALLVWGNPIIHRNFEQILKQTLHHRLPAMYELSSYVRRGGLMAYGPEMDEVVRQAATYVDRILKGANPRDLPIGQPMTFELVINLKTAKALGLTIPPSVLARADEVIQ
jgi:putative ABC transport system substrate-binding protein